MGRARSARGVGVEPVLVLCLLCLVAWTAGAAHYCSPGQGVVSSGASGASVCVSCASASWSPGGVGATCVGCAASADGDTPAGATWTRLGAHNESQCMCADGYAYTLSSDGGVASWGCRPCPSGAVCAAGASAPYPAAVGWAVQGDGTYTRCPSRALCLGPDGCAPGHSGVLCGACSPSYYRIHWECHACSPFPAVRAAAVLLGYIGALLLVAVGVSSGLLRGWLPLVVAFVQDAGLLFVLPINWPDVLGVPLKWASASLVNVDLLALECVFPGLTFYQLWGLGLLSPLLAAAVVAVVLVGRNTCGAHSRDRTMVSRLFSLDQRGELDAAGTGSGSAAVAHASNALVYLLLVVHPLFLLKAVSLFACEGYANVGQVLIFAPHIKCYDSEWWQAMPIAALASFVAVVLGPAGLVGLFVWIRAARHDRVMAMRFGSLYVSYRPSVYAWVLVKALFRASLAGLACTTYTPVLVVMFSLVVRFGVLTAEAFFLPYLRVELDIFHIVGLLATFCVHLFGLVLVVQDKAMVRGSSEYVAARITVAILAAAFAALLAKTGQSLYHYYRKFSKYHIPFKFKASERSALKAFLVSRAYRLVDDLDEGEQAILIQAATTAEALKGRRLHKRTLAWTGR